MNLRDVTLFPVRIPLIEPFVISLGPFTHAANVFVRLRTADGREGWGEASPFPTIHGETQAGCLAIGRFLAEQLSSLPEPTPAALRKLFNRAIQGNFAIKSAFDVALHDLLAQEADLPLHRYLGEGPLRPLYTDYTVSLGRTDDMVAAARRIVARGFPVVKIKLGQEATADLERVAAISAAVGPDIPLRLDANQGWSVGEARIALAGLAPFNVQHCEEPIDRADWTRLPELRRLSPVPLMADESCWNEEDARRLAEIDAVDRVNIKLSKSGGLYTAGRILATTHLPIQVGGFLESRLGFTAAAHLAISDPRIEYCDFDTPLMFAGDPVEGGLSYGAGGRVTVPDAPGLGARLRPDYQLPSAHQINVR